MPIGKCILAANLLMVMAACGFGQAPSQPSAKIGLDEERTLEAAKVATDNKSLLSYLQARTLTDMDRGRIDKLVQDLDSDKYAVREKATKELKHLGRPALPMLKKAARNSPLEVAQRAEKCIQEIAARTAAEPLVEVARLLALRDTPGAAEVLLNYLPFVDDPLLEEEVLASLGKLTVKDGKVDPLLLAALKDTMPEKRAAAVYVVARRADPTQRELVRPLLSDPDPLTRDRAAAGLIGKKLMQQLDDNLQGNLNILRDAKIEVDDAALGKFLAQRSLREEDRVRLQNWVIQLGDKAWSKRDKASAALIAEGTKALPFVKTASTDADAERAARAAHCVKVILAKHSHDPVTAAVVRILAKAGEHRPGLDGPTLKGDPRTLKAADAIAALLDYVPFVEEDALEDDVLASLTLLSVRESKVSTALIAALDDPLPARRGVAAVVLGKVGTRDQMEGIRKLLHDPVSRVQFRAAQGLVAAQDKAAVPVLIDLLRKETAPWAWQVEDQLARIAGSSPPAVAAGATAAEYRKNSFAAWTDWWSRHEASIDLASAQRDDAFLGVFTIVEFDTIQGNRQGRIWECGRDGRQRWEVSNLGGAMDGQVLPNGRLLVAESMFSRVTERDMKGNIQWTVPTPSAPVAVLRLPSGNTFIAMYNHLMEVKADRTAIYTFNKSPQMFIYSASRMRNGHIALMTAQNLVVFDPVSGKDIKTINVGQVNGWAGVDALPNGHFLVSLMGFNQIREVDDTGKVHWQANFQGVFRAIKLPNGNVLACSMTTRRVAELDRGGNEVWGVTCQGRPWNMRFR